MSLENEKGKNAEHIPPVVRCFLVEFKGDQVRFAKSPDIVFLEVNDFFVEHDADGPFLGVKTEKGHYKIRLEKD